ncbi:hypothetical protein [Streptomyces luteogriseus]|uniref:hypothetical protein n=1 Tax=Streptomyces luteogriseus TaxID=68233 RepID=UPI003714C8F5
MVEPQRIAVSIDPSGGGRDTAGIIGGFLGADNRVWITHDESRAMSSAEWSRTACLLAHETDAGVIYVEWNYGRDMCTLAIGTAWTALQDEGAIPKGKLMPGIDAVSTKQGKLLRAEPIAQQMVEDKVRLRGAFVDLEHEWATWQPTDADNPGLIDAFCVLVCGLIPEVNQGARSCTPRCRRPRSRAGSGAGGRRAGRRRRTAGGSPSSPSQGAARVPCASRPSSTWEGRMGDTGGRRRVRVSPARRQPAPGRVRAQEEQETEATNEPTPARWWRRIPWVHVGAVVGAVAAVGGLLFTAITTLYGAKVAEDQLAQSRDDSDQKKREQASRVSYWVDNDETGLHVMNRSLDPVQDVQVWFHIGYLPRMRGVALEDTIVTFAVYLRSLPPCSEVRFERKNFRWTAKVDDQAGVPRGPLAATGRGEPGFRKMLNDDALSFAQLRFVDRDGARWERNSFGNLEMTPRLVTSGHRGEREMAGALLDYPPVKPLGDCKDG